MRTRTAGIQLVTGRWSVFMLLAVSLVLLAGCSNFVDQDQPQVSSASLTTLQPGHTLGQTFVPRHGGLNGLRIWLEPGAQNQGAARLRLRVDPSATQDLATATLSLAQVTTPGYYGFTFPPIQDSHGRYLYAELETLGQAPLSARAAPGDTYGDGALYRDRQPQDAQLAFLLTYDPWWLLVDLGRAAWAGFGLMMVTMLLFVVPGWALLAWLCPTTDLSWAGRLAIGAGVSLALYPVLFLWTDLIGLHLGPLYAVLPAVGGLAALVLRYRIWKPARFREGLRVWAHSDALWPDLLLVVVVGLIFSGRLLVVRTLDAPSWGDSYQHTMITQLMVDHRGLFDSWEPYAPYRSLTVHFGFSSFAALLSWFTAMDSVRATLLVGQLINSLAIVTLYPLATRVAGGNRWAGLGAVLAAGLLSPMPAYYVNWGRYAQLAGQAILPVAVWLLWEVARRERVSWKLTFLAGLVLSGMTLTYYRMPLFYACFVFALLIGWGLMTWRANVRRWLQGMARLAIIAAAALLLTAPWGAQLAGGSLATGLVASVAEGASLSAVLASYGVWRDIAFYVSVPLLLATLVALGWSILRRDWIVVSIGLWVLALALLPAGRLVRIPGTNMVDSFAVLIALYMPVALLVGWLIGQVASLAMRWMGKAGPWALSATVLAIALWAALGQSKIIRPSFILVTRPDMRAMAWIRDNTPPNARFLVEGFRIYGGTSAVGADAGWWIPLLTGRENTMPPQYALVNEVQAEPGYSQRVVDLVAQLEEVSPASEQGLRLLCDRGITHVYVGQGQGKVGTGAEQLFAADALLSSDEFTPVYRDGRVIVFALDPQVCGRIGA